VKNAMKIYIVISTNDSTNQFEVCGVYSDYEKAEIRRKLAHNGTNRYGNSYYAEIEEFDLDDIRKGK
jgi:hypothetical protein